MTQCDKIRPSRRRFVGVMLLAASLATDTTVAVFAQEKAIAPEKNPPGDIPDSQVFITYTSPLGVSLKIPEGWSRKERADGAAIFDKYGVIDVAISSLPTAPTAASAKTGEAVELERNGRAVKIASIKDIVLPAGPAVQIVYTSNSDANAVTGKHIRLENERYLIGRAGKLATLTFSAPAGADNADQWKLMHDSFKWN